MNAKQKARVEWLRQEIIKYDGNHTTGYEYKRFEVVEENGYVFVVSEVGLKNDEGTYACILCRERRHIAIGKRGGMKLLNTGRYSKSEKDIVPAKTKATGKSVVWALTS